MSAPKHQGRTNNCQYSSPSAQNHYSAACSTLTSACDSHYQADTIDFNPQTVSRATNHLILPPASYMSAANPVSSALQPQSFPFLHSSIQHQTFSHYHHSSTTLIYENQNKRKSAVELLAESKPLYVKSETLLDRHQIPHRRGDKERRGMPVGVGIMPSGTQLISSPVKSGQNRSLRSNNRRSASSSSDLLQTKLRKLLNAEATSIDIARCKYEPYQKYDTFSKYQTAKYSQDPEPSDFSVAVPSAFLSPQSLPPYPSDHFYTIGIDDTLVLTDNYQAISPPAEYAAAYPIDANAAKRSRSHSHSHEVASKDLQYASPFYNINSHKSLPDLHSQISRHSPHSEALSFCSRGNRSNKSVGSSINRDSGGSSGHYTHRSEPCCKERNVNTCTPSDFRRDSGSSTQHSGNSYDTYGMSPIRYVDCPECQAKYQKESECLLNFTTPEVPEAFQDDYQDPSGASQPPLKSRTQFSQKDQEYSPPLGTFKRQKCLRFKHRIRQSSSNERNLFHDDKDNSRKPILRSKSDISDRSWNRLDSAKMQRGAADSMSQLEKFFDRLGLNEAKFEEIYALTRRRHSDNDSDQSSTVFFSDVSTVDSTRLPDSTESNPVGDTYRSSGPPSIVERNARIIKWLCNCRKLQLL